MEVAFSEAEADFSNLYTGPGRAYLSRVKHKTLSGTILFMGKIVRPGP